MHIQERRIAKRFPLELRGYAIINGSNVDMRTRNVSQGGGLVKFASHITFKQGMKLLVRFDIGFMARAIICRCDNDALYSIMFDRFDACSDLVLIAYLIRYERHLPTGVTIQ